MAAKAEFQDITNCLTIIIINERGSAENMAREVFMCKKVC
jgi:hypothetical protein